jgi:hypothetical protein
MRLAVLDGSRARAFEADGVLSSRREGRWRRLAIALLLAAPVALEATTYTISSLLDGVGADGECRLREAIRAAQTNLPVNECPAGGPEDTIVLATQGVYAFAGGEEEISGETTSLAIRGLVASADAQTIDLGESHRFLRVFEYAALELSNLTLTRGGFGIFGGSFHFNSGRSLLLRRVTIRSSRSSLQGGAAVISTSQSTAPTEIRIDECRFEENEVDNPEPSAPARAGALHVSLTAGSSFVMERTEFVGNRAHAFDVDAEASGGGLYLTASGGANARIAHTRFLANEVEGERAGAAALHVQLNSFGSVEIEDVVLTGNRSLGGDPAVNGSALQVESHGVEGSAVVRVRRLRAVAPADDTAPSPLVRFEARGTSDLLVDGAALSGGAGGGARVVLADVAEGRLGQMTITGNLGPGFQVESSSPNALRIENSILWGNTDGGTSNDLEVLSGPVDADRATNHNWIGEQGDPDPLFVDPANGDLSLQQASGAIDAGDETFGTVGPYDVTHAPRVVGAGIDLGAFERGGLFADGFESSSVGAWSASVPQAARRSAPDPLDECARIR